MKQQESTSIDEAEIARFNTLAATWWDSSGPMWPLHELNKFRVDVIKKQLVDLNRIQPDDKHPLRGLKVLDIGCGGGILSESLALLGAEVTGIDPAQKSVEIARLHAHKSGLPITYLCQEVQSIDQQFDLVFNMEVVEHVSNLGRFLEASCARVKPGGIMFVATINRTYKSFLFATLGAEYILRLLPKGTHQWSKFVAPHTITQQTINAGLDTVRVNGVSLNPLTRRFRLTGSTAVNYMMTLVKAKTL